MEYGSRQDVDVAALQREVNRRHALS